MSLLPTCILTEKFWLFPPLEHLRVWFPQGTELLTNYIENSASALTSVVKMVPQCVEAKAKFLPINRYPKDLILINQLDETVNLDKR